jgi:hypothetical protein
VKLKFGSFKLQKQRMIIETRQKRIERIKKELESSSGS